MPYLASNVRPVPGPDEALARQQAHASVLSEVWAALDEISPEGERRSITEMGFVAAASTDGARLRVLLRIPGTFCRDLGSSRLLARLAGALSEIQCLRDVHLSLKAHRPMLIHDSGDWARRPASQGDSVQPTGGHACGAGAHSHAACLQQAITGMRYSGWELSGFQQYRIATSTPDDPDTVRVLVQAEVDLRERFLPDGTRNPLGAA